MLAAGLRCLVSVMVIRSSPRRSPGRRETLAYAHTSFFSNEPAEALADCLAGAAPPGLSRVYFVDSGSAAVETALKMARQYQIERGAPGRTRVISRRQSYHGNTLGALAVSGNAGRRAPYEPFLFESRRIDPCFEYRYAREGQTAEDYGRQAADALEAELLRVGPETVMAFIAETVVGATTGAVPPAPGYLRRIREICDRHDVLLILDEVMCGAGRTGSFLACEQDGVVPDIVTLAKGLAGGYQPIGAVLCSDKVYEAFRGRHGCVRERAYLQRSSRSLAPRRLPCRMSFTMRICWSACAWRGRVCASACWSVSGGTVMLAMCGGVGC